MTPNDITAFAESWIAYWHTEEGSVERDELFPICELEGNLVREAPHDAWKLILRILELDKSVQIREVLSAGPLEDLLSYHGEALIDTIETEARANPHFAQLLGGVWQNAMPTAIWSRVQAVQDRRGWDGEPAH
ncbi:MAG: hypothetical protein RLZZ618_3308 [Pseudomonadota bacterium]|jgi:hypothetical protein